MGNLCGKASKDDNFAGPGRTLGAAPTPATKASVPAKLASAPGTAAAGPGRTLGGGGGGGGGSGVAGDSSGQDPRTAAAKAAEARANQPVTGGDLARKLEEQKKQTRAQTLQQAADETRAQREADAAAEQRNYN